MQQQKIVVKFRNRVTGEIMEVERWLPEKEGRIFRTGDFRYRGHEVVN